MTSVTQQVPNYVLGMSEQPDELKSPGQVVNLKNGLPDITRGLMKRPGSDLISAVTPAASGKWFYIYRADEEGQRFIGQVATTGAIKVWRCSDGVEIPVDYANVAGSNLATYLIHTNSDEIQSLNLNETVLFTNRKTTVAMKSTSTDKTNVSINEAFISIRSVAYGKQYSLDIFDPDDNSTITYNTATSVECKNPVGTGSIPGYANDGKCAGQHRMSVPPNNTSSGTAIGDTSPPNASSGGKSNLRYEIDIRCVPVSNGSDYDDSYQGYAKLQCGGEGWTTGDEHAHTNSKGSSTTVKVLSHAAITARANVALVRPPSTSADGNEIVASETIISGIKNALDAIPGTGITTTICGNGLHLYRATPFQLTTAEGQLMDIITTSANDITELPKACRHGYVVRVVNSGEEEDDYYLKFKAEGTEEDIDQSGTYARAASGSLSGSYTRSGTTITITDADHGLIVGDQVVCAFSGAATDGTYTIANITADTFTVTDSASGTIGATSMTYTHGICTITTTANHGLSTGDIVSLDYTSGAATDGQREIIVTGSTTFTVGDLLPGSISSGETVTFTPYSRFGTGTWEECAAPDLDIKFDQDTMPLRLNRGLPSTQYTIATSAVNTSNEQITATSHGRSTGDVVLYKNGGGTTLAGLTDATNYYVIKVDANTIKLATSSANATAGTAINLTGTGNNAQTLIYGSYSINGAAAAHYVNGIFRFEYPAWDDRDVGDDITNPKPSFVGNTINKVFYYRNRLGFLSAENAILSRTNDYFNFWAKTAFAISNADPIDLQSSSTHPASLYDAVEVNNGLLMFSANEQFLLSTDESLMTPETARISYLSSYAFNEKTHPFSLGVTVGFINSTAKNSRFYEMINIQRNSEPDVAEQSKVISKLFPDDIDLPAASTENNVVLFGTQDNNEVWGYRYFNQAQKRVQSAWFKWILPGTVTFHTIMDDVYYAIIKNSSNYTLESIDLKKEDDTTLVDTEAYKIHLDTKSVIASGSLSYATSTNKTKFTKPTGYNSSSQLAVYCHKTGSNKGRYAEGTIDGSDITFEGDWTGQDIVLGYLYEMEVELPTVYVQQKEGSSVRSETRGSLIVHRLNFTFGTVGLIDVTLKRKGRSDYTKTYESIEWDSYSASSLGIAEDYIHTIPAYDKNTNLSVHLKSSHPAPATLHSMTWEGDYNSKYYKRV